MTTALARLALASVAALALLACSAPNAPTDGGLDAASTADAQGSPDASSATVASLCATYVTQNDRCNATPSPACTLADNNARCRVVFGTDRRGAIVAAYSACVDHAATNAACPNAELANVPVCVENLLATMAPARAVLDGLTAVCTSCAQVRGGGSADDCVHALVYNGLSSGGDPSAIVNLWGVDGADASAMGQCLTAAATVTGDCGTATNRCLYPTTPAPPSTCVDQ